MTVAATPKLTPYEQTQLARHPMRPNTLEIIGMIAEEFIELHGDRNFLDDKAIVAGIGRIGPFACVIIGHQKGRGTKDNIFRNFGMPRPEGYRKALRMMSLAERMRLPIVTFVDTPGAYPGVDAEERGQSEAIAKNIFVMSRIRVPLVTVVLGEGGSGGALAIAVSNRVHMLQHSIYSVISPEGCASILMKDASKAPIAAKALRLTSQELFELGIIDSMIDEPEGGAHNDPQLIAQRIKTKLLADLTELSSWEPEKLKQHRIEKYMAM